jgi:hypothetical protein
LFFCDRRKTRLDSVTVRVVKSPGCARLECVGRTGAGSREGLRLQHRSASSQFHAQFTLCDIFIDSSTDLVEIVFYRAIIVGALI